MTPPDGKNFADVGAPIRGNGSDAALPPGERVRAGGRSGSLKGEWREWRGSWRLGLRMARRDVRRARGRSVLVVLMILVPVTLISYAVTASQSVAYGPLTLDNSLGAAQGRIDSVQANVVLQDSEQSWGVDETRAATPIAGYDPEADLGDQADALSELLGAPVIPEVTSRERAALAGDRNAGVIVLSVPRADGLAPKVELLTGRWPRTPDEVLVTPRGHHDGLPAAGSLTLTKGGTDREVEVVGTAQGRLDYDLASLVSVPAEQLTEGDELSWLVLGDEPITWSDIRRLNESGLAILSREALANPPSDAELDPLLLERGIDSSNGGRDDSVVIVTLFGSLLLFVFAALMVAPAFAVGAARQRRTLALIASNGATTSQLRRSVLAQAVLLGSVAAILGVLLGVCGVAAQVAIIREFLPWQVSGDLVVPGVALVCLLLTAIAAVVSAALIPAARLGRLDIVGVMRGQSVSPPVSRRLPLIGTGLAIFGALSVVLAFATAPQNTGLPLLGATALVLGVLLTIPMLLVIASNLARRAPLPIRMAARDAARHRARAVPTVAAVMAGAAILTISGIAGASDDAQERRDYQPSRPFGEMSHAWDLALDPSGQEIHSVLSDYGPELKSYETHALGSDWEDSWVTNTHSEGFVLFGPPSCTAASSFADFGDTAGQAPCALSGTHTWRSAEQGGIYAATYASVIPAAEIVRLYQLSGTAAEAVRQGAVVSSDPDILAAESLQAIAGTIEVSDTGDFGALITNSESEVRVVPVSPELTRANGAVDYSLVAPLELATELDWPTYLIGLGIYDPTGPISESTEEAILSHLSERPYEGVERGYSNSFRWVILGMFVLAGCLIISVTLIATALAVSEQQTDLATYAAVGATRRTRRQIAAAQAGLIALLGCGLGIVLGFTPGIAFTYPLTADGFERIGDSMIETTARQDPVIVIPWLGLLAIVVLVPLIAAGLAALAIRRAPSVTQRAA